MKNSRLVLFASLSVLWLIFTYWYTNTEGPLTEAEKEHYLTLASQRGDTAVIERFKEFLDGDEGDSFVMFNVLDLATDPELPEGAASGTTASELIAHYMEFMFPALLRRACHPIYSGVAFSPAMDLVGLEEPDIANWTQGALMRYRSRRDLIEIALDPRFNDRHDYKIAALTKTIAFPVETTFSYSDPRVLLALVLLSLALLIDRVFANRG
ncbi:MAG: hypothetical protein AAF098_15745 [Pseudomonadota bacterium]